MEIGEEARDFSPNRESIALSVPSSASTILAASHCGIQTSHGSVVIRPDVPHVSPKGELHDVLWQLPEIALGGIRVFCSYRFPVASDWRVIARKATMEVLAQEVIATFKDAARKLTGPKRRAFEAQVTLDYLDGSIWKAETVFGWSHHTVALGLNELRTGITCVDNFSARGNRKTEAKFRRRSSVGAPMPCSSDLANRFRQHSIGQRTILPPILEFPIALRGFQHGQGQHSLRRPTHPLVLTAARDRPVVELLHPRARDP